MSKKVILIPSADRNLFPDSQIVTIEQVNSANSPTELVDLSRKKFKGIPASESPNLKSANTVRIDFALRMRSALENLSPDVDSLKKSIDFESIGENTSWSELKVTFIRIQELLFYHSSTPTFERPKPTIALKPMDKAIGLNPLTDNTETATQAYYDFVKLLGYRKDNTKAIANLINKGIDFEKAVQDPKTASKLGRDPFDTPSE